MFQSLNDFFAGGGSSVFREGKLLFTSTEDNMIAQIQTKCNILI